VVVCPNSLKGNWRDEAMKWGFKNDWNIRVWPEYGAPADEAMMFVINYEALIAKGGKVLEEILSKRSVYLVLDESSHIKNPQAKRTRWLIANAANAEYRRILTGTPITQGPHDAWAQFRFLGALTGVNFYSFRNHFCQMGGWQMKQVKGPRNVEELNEFINKNAFRARKDDWSDLPEKIYMSREVEMSGEQRAAYRDMKRDFLVMLGEVEITADLVLTQLGKLAQISSGFVMNGESQPIGLVSNEQNPKIQALNEILDETRGKTIIFTRYRWTTAQLYAVLPGAAILQGEMTAGDVEDNKRRFNEDPECRYIVAQVSAARFGHTLLGGAGDDRCSTSIFFENDFSLETRLQAEDRNHRFGQDKAVVYHDLIASPIERMVVNALLAKKKVADAVVDGILARGDEI